MNSYHTFLIKIIEPFSMRISVPASSSRVYDDGMHEERRKEALREEIRRARPTVSEVRERYKSLDERLARIEKYVTSSRYDLDEEFRRL